MKGHECRVAAAAAMMLACIVPVRAVSTHAYKPNEYAVIRDGTAPDRQHSVAAHGNGDDGSEDFHLYLMAEPGHKRIGPLEEVGPDILDTGPDAFQAVWSADSRHVALLYRVDRHVMAMRLYRIESRRAYPVVGDSLFHAATNLPEDSSEDREVRSLSNQVTWTGPAKFVLKEHRFLRTRTPELAHLLGRFGRQETPEGDNPGSYLIEFSAEAECELISGDRYRILDVKPGRFDT